MNKLAFFVSCVLGCSYSVMSGASECLSELQDPSNDSEKDQEVHRIAAINISNNPIFDESDPHTIAIHRIANWLHINTKEKVIKERLPVVIGDEVTVEALCEAERIIRNESYIRDARVKMEKVGDDDGSVKVDVATWDNWSMLPTVSFGRKGGKNKYSLGFKEDNLLGLGIRARVKYKKDEQRTGYKFSFRTPVSILKHSTLIADFEDNDDGQRTQLTLDKPFYQTSSTSMFYANYLTESRTEEIYQNGLTRNNFALDGQQFDIATGWLIDRDGETTNRLKVGFSQDKTLFSLPHYDPGIEFGIHDELFLPKDRDYLYPWVAWEHKQADFRILQDVYLINQIEDINLGWHNEVQFGVELNNKGLNDGGSGNGLGSHLKFTSSRGYQWNNNLLLVSVEGKGDFDVQEKDQLLIQGTVEYFKRANDKIGYYARAGWLSSKNPYLDRPNALGGENGVRGYPLQYQHGDHSMQLTAETRYYPNLNLYKLFDVGFVGFVDVGKAWSGNFEELNESDSIIGSVGIGARIYSNRSSHRNVVHIDIAKPMTNSINIDSWEWRLQVKSAF